MKRLGFALLVVSIVVSILVGCGPTPEPVVVKETVVVRETVAHKVV